MTHRRAVADTVNRAFSLQGGSTLGSIAIFVATLLLTGWFINNTAPLLALIGREAFSALGWLKLSQPSELWKGAIADAIVPCFAEVGIVCVIWRNVRKNAIREQHPIRIASPPPSAGLIVMLSPFRAATTHPYKTGGDVVNHMSDKDFRDQLLDTNWGTLVASVEHHADAPLKHCWVVLTPGNDGSAPDYPWAKRVIEHFAPEAECHDVKLHDAYDISSIVPEIDTIYRNAPAEYNLEAENIVADFTGGTAAMSGGMILATAQEDRRLQYLRQIGGPRSLCPGGVPLSKQQIRDKTLLVTVLTSPSMVTANQKPN